MTDSLRSIIPLSKDSMRGVEPSKDLGDRPEFVWVDPRELFVEEDYQRDLSENSISLIRRIIAGFAWDSFKPPVCVRRSDLDGALLCIDGQHTAISCASHPDIGDIPIMIVGADTMAKRASAFVRHNRDRIGLTQMAIFFAELASEDPTAMIVDRACKSAGARILNKPINLKQRTKPGETIAVGTIRNLAKRNGEEFLARVLKLLTDIGRGPLRADEIAGVALVLERSPDLLDARLSQAVGSKTAEQWSALASMASASGSERGPAGEVLASLWSREMGVRLPGKPKPAPKPEVRKPMSEETKAKLRASATAQHAARRAAAPLPSRASAVPTPPKPRATAAPAPRPALVPKPPLPKPQPKPAIAPPPAQPQPASVPALVQHAGIVVDTGLGWVRRGRQEASVPVAGAKLLSLLARVRPAFLESSDLIHRLGLDAFRLRTLVTAVNREIGQIGLEVRNVMKTGWMLAELD